MTAGVPADVLVVGHGPAGSVAAMTLARHGMNVVLVGKDAVPSRFDVLLTGQARAMLAAAGLAGGFAVRPADVVELRFGASRARTITGSGAAVCDWNELRAALRAAAVRAGARYVRGTVTGLDLDARTSLAVLECSGRQARIRARHVVVAAGGAASALLPSAPPDSGLVCARRYRGVRLGDQVIMVLPAPAPTALNTDADCVWVLPGEDDTVTVGTVKRTGDERADPGRLQREALRALAAADPRFARLRPAAVLSWEPLHAGFLPSQVAAAGCMLAGDAAGLVNPFTGEGLSSAVLTGRLAAEFIAASPARPQAARRRYAGRLRATFVGAFETSRHAARRYHLTWRILASGAASDHPFFVKARRALLLPEGPAGLAMDGRLDIRDPDTVLVGPFLAACDEVAIGVVRKEWPFLARLALAGESLGQPRLRPAALFFAALLAAGDELPVRHAPLGAAIELAHLGASSLFGSVVAAGPAGAQADERGVDWALAATLLSGDFLLGQASRMVATYAPEASWAFAEWLAELAALRAGRLTEPGDVPAGALFASLLEFPARMGALSGSASPPVTAAVRDFGHHCGHAFLHAEELLALRGQRTRLDTTLEVMLSQRISDIAGWAPGSVVSAATLARDARLRSSVISAAAAECEAARRRGLAALDAVHDPVAGRILRKFMTAVTAPVLSLSDSVPTGTTTTMNM